MSSCCKKVSKLQMDEYCKRFLSKKLVLALILGNCVPEYMGRNREEICACICDDIKVNSEHVHRREPESIIGENAEDATIDEGLIRFDVKFTARSAENAEEYIILNIEAQNDLHPGYPLAKRATYYVARLLSAQKKTVWEHSEYDRQRKVYSIWVFLDADKNQEGFINHYTLCEKQLYGNYTLEKRDYSDFNFIFIGLSKNDNENEMIDTLSTYFSKETTNEEKVDTLVKIGVPPQEAKEESDTMCHFSELIWKDAMLEGEAKGRAEGRAEGEAKGRAEGEAKGRAEGRAEGEAKGRADTVLQLMRNTGKTFDEIAMLLGYSEKEITMLKPLVDAMLKAQEN